MNKKEEELKNEWERFDQELREYIYEDPVLFAQMTPEEINEDLVDMGADLREVAALREKIVAAIAVQADANEVEVVTPNLSPAAEQKRLYPEDGLQRRLFSCLDVFWNTARMATANESATENEQPRELALTKFFSKENLRTKLPWAGDNVRIVKCTIGHDPKFVRYMGLISKSTEIASRLGKLRIVLETPDGLCQEVVFEAGLSQQQAFSGDPFPIEVDPWVYNPIIL